MYLILIQVQALYSFFVILLFGLINNTSTRQSQTTKAQEDIFDLADHYNPYHQTISTVIPQ